MSKKESSEQKVKMKLEMDPDGCKDYLKHIIRNNKFLQETGQPCIALEIEGESGIGKTSIVEQVAEELDLHYTKINLAQIGEEISELVGYPIKQFEMCKGEECIWVDDHALEEYRGLGYVFTGKNRTSYCPPEWIVGKNDRGGIFNLDDWTRGSVRAIQAVMEVIQRQEYISWKMPKGWTVVLTANPNDGNYLVNETDDAQKTRYISTNIRFDKNCWARYAESIRLDGRCINFLLLHPDLVTRECNPRAITNFFNSISSFKDFKANLPMIQVLGEGSVGVEFASMFTTFIENKLDKLVDPETMVVDKDYDRVKSLMKECIGSPFRADIASVLATRILNYSLMLSEKGGVGEKVIDRVEKLITDDVLKDDQKYFIAKGLVNRGNGKFPKILLNPAVANMIKR